MYIIPLLWYSSVMTNDENMTTTDLVNTIGHPGHVDTFDIARFRTPDIRIAEALEEEILLLGFSVTTLDPSETWHKEHAVVAWGEVRR